MVSDTHIADSFVCFKVCLADPSLRKSVYMADSIGSSRVTSLLLVFDLRSFDDIVTCH